MPNKRLREKVDARKLLRKLALYRIDDEHCSSESTADPQILDIHNATPKKKTVAYLDVQSMASSEKDESIAFSLVDPLFKGLNPIGAPESSEENEQELSSKKDSKRQFSKSGTPYGSRFYLLDEDKNRYQEAPCFHGVSRIDDSLQSYEDYLMRNVRRLIRKPWQVNIVNLRVCMTNDILDSIPLEEFQDVRTVAAMFIDKVLADAVDLVNKQKSVEEEDEVYTMPSEVDSSEKETFYFPQMGHFDVDHIKQTIRNYVNLWQMDSAYSFFIRYLSKEETDTSQLHYYQVMFSKVTISCPNPQPTASVYFTVEATPVVSQRLPVRVSYKFEGYTQSHVPDGRYKFQQFVINNIIKHKIVVFTELEF